MNIDNKNNINKKDMFVKNISANSISNTKNIKTTKNSKPTKQFITDKNYTNNFPQKKSTAVEKTVQVSKTTNKANININQFNNLNKGNASKILTNKIQQNSNANTIIEKKLITDFSHYVKNKKNTQNSNDLLKNVKLENKKQATLSTQQMTLHSSNKRKKTNIIISCFMFLFLASIAIGIYYALPKKDLTIDPISTIEETNYTSDESTETTSTLEPEIYTNITYEEQETFIENNLISNESDGHKITKRYNKTTVPEILPVEKDNYPNANNTVIYTTEQKQEIINESKYQLSSILDDSKNGTLKKHPSADYQFDNTSPIDYTKVSRVDKEVTINPVLRGWRAVGFALAGEIIEIEFPVDYKRYGDTAINIGMSGGTGGEDQNLVNTSMYNNSRMPYLSKTISTSTYIGDDENGNKKYVDYRDYIENNTLKIGSPMGGMIYIRTWDASTSDQPFVIKVRGIVEAPIYVLGVTTDQEWDRLRVSPGLMAEIRMESIRMVMTAKYVRNVKNMRQVAEYWYKTITMSEHAACQEGRNLPITLMYDCRVDAGAAVAYVGAWYCQMPSSWASGVVNYNTLLNQGEWGSFHEMHHHIQGAYSRGGKWGLAGGGEVTNNVLTALSYIQYSNIASNRTTSGGLGGWNYVSDGYNTMKTIYSGSNDSVMLRSYLGLAHGLGIPDMVKFIRSYYTTWYNNNYETSFPEISRDSQSAFCLLASITFNYDMRYYCSLFNYTIDHIISQAIEYLNLPTYYPIFNLYCNSYNGNKYGRTFNIKAGEETIFDFATYMAIDPSLSYTLEVTGFNNGTLTKISDKKYSYLPNSNIKTDTFNLKLTLQNGTIINLGGHITINYDHVQFYKYSNVTSTDIDDAINQSMSISPTTGTSDIMGLPSYSDGSSKSLNKVFGSFYFKTSGYYTLFLKSDDKALLKVNLGQGMESICENTSYTSNYNKTNNQTYKTIYLNANQLYSFEIYNLNTGGNGWVRVGYVFDGQSPLGNYQNSNILDINKSNIALQNLNSFEHLQSSPFISPKSLYFRPVKNLTTIYESVNKSSIQIISAPPGATGDGGGTSAMIDGNLSTFYHTSYPGRGGATTFPCEFIFENPLKQQFNQISIAHRRQSDAIGDYEIYIGDELNAMNLIYSGRNTNSNLVYNLADSINSKYIKIVAKNNVNGNAFVVISEFSLNMRVFNESYMNVTNSKISSSNMDIDCSSYYASSKGLVGSGEIEIQFTGSTFTLYCLKDAKFGSFDVFIDGVNKCNINLFNTSAKKNALVYAATLNYGTHLIKLVAHENSLFNLSLFAYAL